jgi:hypothetical protein
MSDNGVILATAPYVCYSAIVQIEDPETCEDYNGGRLALIKLYVMDAVQVQYSSQRIRGVDMGVAMSDKTNGRRSVVAMTKLRNPGRPTFSLAIFFDKSEDG